MSKPLVLALGTFDGLHLGHRALIERTLSLAKEKAYRTACYTFTNVPASYSLGLSNLQLMSPSHKEALLRELGLDVLILKEFNELIMNTEPEDFVRELVSDYEIAYMVVGKDFRFGRKGSGTSLFLKSLGEKYGYQTEIIDFVYDEEGKLSSSRLRAKLREGDIEGCRHILGRNYGFMAPVLRERSIDAEGGVCSMKPGFDIAPVKHGAYKALITNPEFREEVRVSVVPSSAPSLWQVEFAYDGAYDFGSGLYSLEFLYELDEGEKIKDEIEKDEMPAGELDLA